MAAEPITFKGKRGLWAGAVDTSAMDFGRFTWKRLLNCYVSADGSEIRRMPGLRHAAILSLADKSLIDATTDPLIAKAVTAVGATIHVEFYDDHQFWNERQTTTEIAQVTLSGFDTTPSVNGNTYIATVDIIALGRKKISIPTGVVVVNSQVGTVTPANLNAVASMTKLHGFAQVRERIIVFGEHGFIKVPIGSTVASGIDRYVGNHPAATITLRIPGPNSYAPAAGEWIYVSGTTGAGAAFLNNQWLQVASVVGNLGSGSLQVVVNITGGTLSGTFDNPGGGAWAVRPLGEDKGGLAVWHLDSRPNIQTPESVTPQLATSATLLRDFGINLPLNDAALIREGYNGTPRRKTKTLPGRLNPDESGDRALLGCPGYGVTWEVPVVLPPLGAAARSGIETAAKNTQFDKPRCLGLPKGVLSIDFTEGTNSTIPTPAGTYLCQIAFKDEFTNEIGLASDPITLTITANANRSFTIKYIHPAYLLAECMPSNVFVFLSKKSTGTATPEVGFYKSFRVPIYGAVPQVPGTYTLLVPIEIKNYNPDDATRAELDLTIPPPSFQQMPMGCKALRTIRAFTLFGGQRGSHGVARELQKGGVTPSFGNASYNRRDQLTVRLVGTTAVVNDEVFHVAGPGIPPAYAGSPIFVEDIFEDPLLNGDPGTRKKQVTILLKKLQAAYGSGPEAWATRWLIEGYRFPKDATNLFTINSPAYLLLPTGHIQWSEPGVPSIASGLQRLPLDSENNEDVEAIGRYGNSAVLCTKNQTLMLSWGLSIKGALPGLVSSEFGCIAPNSMVEFDGGLTWLSDRGPVALMRGGVQWVGQSVSEGFVGVMNRYQRDSLNMMRHAWACHDKDRGLVYFGVRTNRLADTQLDELTSISSPPTVTYATASDDAKSKFPCDTVLVWSYRANAWSTWEPRVPLVWMGRVPCSDGIWRVGALGTSGTLYCLEDAAQDGNWRGVRGIASVSVVNSNTFTVAANSFNVTPDQYTNDTYVEAGMEYVIYTLHPDSTMTVKGTGTITGFGGDAQKQLTLSSSHSWTAGDYILVGWSSMTIETNRMNMGLLDNPKRAVGIAGRCTLWSRYVTGEALPPFPNALPPPVFMRVVASGGGAAQTVTKPEWEAVGFLPNVATKIKASSGAVRGDEVSYTLTFIGAQQVRLGDLGMEVE